MKQSHPRWKLVKCSDIVDVRDGTHDTPPKVVEGYPLVTSKNLNNGKIDFSDVTYISEGSFREVEKRSRVDDGDVLMAMIGTIGSPVLVAKDREFAIKNVALFKLPKGKVNGSFFVHLLNSQFVARQLNQNSRGGNQKFVSLSVLRGMWIPDIPLSEQKRIAEILDRAEALRAKRRAALALLDELTQSIFLDMFGDPVSNPKGWENSKTLADVASIGSGITKGRRTTDPVRTVPYLAVVNVQDKMLDLSVVKTIDATEKEIDRYRLKKNDLLLTEGGDADKLGRGTLWSEELPECIHQNHIFRVRIESNDVSPLFLNWLVGGPRGKSYFLRQAKQTTGIATINMAQLKSFPMLIPPKKIQLEFANRIQHLEGLRSTQTKSLTELDQLFASLQHRAFRGEL